MSGLLRTCAIATIYAAIVGAQAPARPRAFGVASVKASESDVWTAMERSGGRIKWTANRLMLLTYAYRLRYFQIFGVETENKYHAVEAVTDPAPTDDEVRQMFQTLLKERFDLAVHREKRTMPVYSLTAQKDGVKLHAATAGQ